MAGGGLSDPGEVWNSPFSYLRSFAYGNTMERKWRHMSDFELLSIVLGFVGILVSVLVAYINSLN